MKITVFLIFGKAVFLCTKINFIFDHVIVKWQTKDTSSIGADVTESEIPYFKTIIIRRFLNEYEPI